MFGLGDFEVLALALLALLLFGKDLPNMMRKVGASIYRLKHGIHEAQEELRKSIDDQSKP